MENIPFFDLKRQYQNIKDEILPAVDTVFSAAAFSGGKFVDEFEKDFAAYCETTYARGVNSGTSSIQLALRCLDIKNGDEVIVPTHTFIASAWPIVYLGAKPIFVDCLPDTWEIDPAAVEKAITERTKAIIGVHLYGVPCDIDALQKIAKKHNIPFIEDCAQAHGALYHGKKAGSSGDIACFSFYPSKNLGAYGAGGALTTNNEHYAELLSMMRNHGIKEKYIHEIIGYNMRMDGVQAAILKIKIKHLDAWNARRQEIAGRYRSEIQNPLVSLQKIDDNIVPVYHLFVVTTPDRASFVNHLKELGVETAFHYPVPCHLQEAFAFLGYKKGDFPNSEYIAQSCVSLPMFPELTDEEVSRVIAAVNSYQAS